MLHKLGSITIRFSPGSIFRTFITAPKIFRGSRESIDQRMALCRRFDSEIYKGGRTVENVGELVTFAQGIISHIGSERRLSEDEKSFLEYTSNTVNDGDNQELAKHYYEEVAPKLTRLIDSHFVSKLFASICAGAEAEFGEKVDWVDIDGTYSAVYGSANYGKFIPDTRVIAVQLDKVLKFNRPDLGFADVSFHEEFHAYADQKPKVTLPNPIEEEFCEYLPKQLIAIFLSSQKIIGLFSGYSEAKISDILSDLWVDHSDENRHYCVAKMLKDHAWGLRLLLELKKYSDGERKRACSDADIINRAIRAIWPETSFSIPFYCNEHNYGIG